jgi:tetratricopeptide (TPR) repeat protein
MKHARGNRAATFAAALVVIAMAVVACSSSPGSGASSERAGLARTTGQPANARVASLIQAGITQSGQDNWSGAAATFQRVLAIEPGNVYANYDLGVIAQSAGNSAKAVGYYNKALAGNTAYTPALYNEAILIERSQPQQAIAMYQKIVSIDGKASTAYLRMAFLQAERGDLADARTNDAKAVSIDPVLARYSLPAAK